MKNEGENDHLKGRIRDLWRGASQQEYMTHSRFLSLAEQADTMDVLSAEGAPAAQGRAGEGPFWLLRGGTPEADRRILICCPSWMEMPEKDPGEIDSGLICCLRAEPKSERFTDHPGHRDYLGALMNLGFTREQIGDIYADEGGAWIFVMKEMSEVVIRELISVRHTAVKVREVPLEACTAAQRTEVLSGSIASERIDCIVAMAFHLSRGQAQSLIEAEKVYSGGRIVSGPAYRPAPGERISVRGKGKFIYLGVRGTTRKGRMQAGVSMFV